FRRVRRFWAEHGFGIDHEVDRQDCRFGNRIAGRVIAGQFALAEHHAVRPGYVDDDVPARLGFWFDDGFDRQVGARGGNEYRAVKSSFHLLRHLRRSWTSLRALPTHPPERRWAKFTRGL